MLIKAGCNLAFDCVDTTPIIAVVRVRPERAACLVQPETVTVFPEVPLTHYRDTFGNICTRFVAPPGRVSLWNRFVISDSGEPEPQPAGALQHPVETLGPDMLLYLKGSRYCETDKLTDFAWRNFGGYWEGWNRVFAILEFVHDRIRFNYSAARSTRTAVEALEERTGVCRDYAHLAITLCRCMNIPARYCTGYLGDIGVPRDPAPMDFSAWFEVYLGGQWWPVDARHHQRRIGRIPIAYGRDAADVPFSTAFGHAPLTEFAVITEELSPA